MMTDDTGRLVSGFGAGNLFQILRDGTPRTRSELAMRTGFARATISARLDELVASGLVKPAGDALSTGGRPSARVALNAGARVVGAADLGASHATIAIIDLAGEVLASETSRRHISEGPDSSLDWVVDTLLALLERTRRPLEDLIAVGIGLPGPVEHSTGRPSNPPIMPGWDGYNVPARVQLRLHVPVLVDNDVNIMALGERAKGWPDMQEMIFVKVATGIGSGIISGGTLQRGSTGSAGDIGHIPIARAENVVCRCGNTGCLEAVAAAPAIASLLSAGDAPLSSETIIDRVRLGDIEAIGAVRQAGRDIGSVLTTMVSILNPSLIVVGGLLAQSGEHLIAGIRETVYSRSMPLATEHLTIASTRVGPDAGVIGAGILAIDHVLSPEQIDSGWALA
jgi:predicted NBD/HSP70 family sugar kinase